MNKHVKNYKSKHKPLAEKLQTKTVSLGQMVGLFSIKEYLIALGIAVATPVVGYHGMNFLMDKYDNYKKDQKTEQKISQLLPEDQDMFKSLKNAYYIGDYFATDQTGASIKATELVKRSTEGKEAKEYAKNLTELIHAGYPKTEFKTLDSKIQLAKEVIDGARTYLQRRDAGGAGNYSLAFEYSEERERMRKELEKMKESSEEHRQISKLVNESEFDGADSIQTFDEFKGPKNGVELSGDCDDFSMALTTTYHAVKDYAEANKGKEKFYDALAEGLDHYRVFSAGVHGHEINMSVTHKDMPYMEIIEPQNKSDKFDTEFADDGIFPSKLDKDGNREETKKILHIFNRDVSIRIK